MTSLLNEVVIRLGAFAAILLVMVVSEAAFPRRRRLFSRGRRWLTNLSIAALGTGVVRAMALVAVPLTATAAALWVSARDGGLFGLLDWPVWLEVALSLLLLDVAIWFQHLVSHRVPILWRLHRVHHADRDFDATTALRFHPIEIGFSMLLKTAVVFALGPAVVAVIAFEIALNGFAIFNHANLRLPDRVESALRLILVTPDLHRVHHSVYRDEHDSNYGFSISLWDRLFRTYRDQPRDGHRDMAIGLSTYQSDEAVKLGWSLRLPFARRYDKNRQRGSGD